MKVQKFQRAGLSEGTLLYNNWLKQFGLYRRDTEDEFINWLYSTSGWYDSNIPGSHFDIGTNKVRESGVYQDFLREYRQSLYDSDQLTVLLHSSYHLRGLTKEPQFIREFNPKGEYPWHNIEFLKSLLTKNSLVVSSIAPLIEDKYGVRGYQAPQTHLNSGPDKNAFETLSRVEGEVKGLVNNHNIDFVFVSFGAYGCLLVDRLVKSGVSSATIGSSLYKLFPLDYIPAEFRPKDYLKVEDGRYWLI